MATAKGARPLVLVAACAAVLALGGVWLFARDRGGAGLREGRWEIVLTDGAPAPKGASADGGAAARPARPPETTTECLTAESPAPRGGLPPGCQVWDAHAEGPHLRWRVHCTLGYQGDGVGSAEVRGDTLAGTFSLRMGSPMNRGPRTTLRKLTGRRLGPCE